MLLRINGMYTFLILTILVTGNAVYPPVKRDARISKTDMQKSLNFVRKDASHCRRELKDFRTKLAALNGANKKKGHIK